MNNLEKKVLEKIKREKIKPKKHLFFAIKWIAIKILIASSLILSAFTFSVILKIVLQGNFAYAKLLSGGYFMHFVQLAGLLWLGLLFLFMVFVRLEVYKSKYGYRIYGYKVSIITLSISLLLGVFIYNYRLDYVAENIMGKILPYASFKKRQEQIWHQPTKGLYLGTTLQDYDEKMTALDFIDINGQIWRLDLNNISKIDKIILKYSPKIVILAQKSTTGTLKVCAIKPAPTPRNINFKDEMLEEIKLKAGTDMENRKGLFLKWKNIVDTDNETKNNFLRKYKCTQNAYDYNADK